MTINVGDVDAGRDVNIIQLAHEPDTERRLREFQVAREEDKPALAKRLLEEAPDIVVRLLMAAIPHLLK